MSLWAERVLLVVAVVAVVLVGLDLARTELQRRRVRRHLERLGRGGAAPAEDDTLPRPSRIARRLRAAGLPLGSVSFLIGTILLALVVFDAFMTLLPQVPVAAAAGTGLALYAPWVLVESLGAWRARRFEKQLVDALGVLTSSVAAGENLTQALRSVGDASTGAAGREFRAVTRRLAAGMDLRRAVRPLADDYDSEAVQLFAQAITAKSDVGGDLTPVLDAVSRVVRERQRVRLQFHSQVSGARLSAVLIAIFPYAAIPIYVFFRPQSLEILLGHPWGPSLLTVAVVLQIVGALWMRRLLRIEL